MVKPQFASRSAVCSAVSPVFAVCDTLIHTPRVSLATPAEGAVPIATVTTAITHNRQTFPPGKHPHCEP